MELSEAIRRILRPHRIILIGLLLLGMGSSFLLYVGQGSGRYKASARLVLDTPDPKAAAEAQAIADTARAIVTSPGLVGDALKRIGRSPTPDAVTRYVDENVSLQALGSSEVLELTVTDRDPKAAADLTNLLAAALIDVRTKVTSGRQAQVLAELDTRIAELDREIAETKLVARNRSTGSPPATLISLTRLRDSLASERVAIVLQEALRPKASIVDPARPPTTPVPSRPAAYLALGALFGLIVGVGSAALLEAFKPTVVGKEAVAREVGAPILGEIDVRNGGRDARPDWLASRVRMAAGMLNGGPVEFVDIGPVGASTDGSALAARLDAATREALEAASRKAQGDERVGVRGVVGHVPGGGVVSSGDERPTTSGIVVVAPTVVKQADLRMVNDVVRATRRPLLGIVTYRPRWFSRKPTVRLESVEMKEAPVGAEGSGGVPKGGEQVRRWMAVP